MLTQQPTDLITEPLAVQFMTGGQMGYMPQAQFLTPAEYGAFRTMPVSPQNNFLQQDPGFIQSFLIQKYGGPFGLPRYTFNTYNPAVNQQLHMHQIETRSLDSLLGSAGTATDVAFQMLLGSAAGMLLGGPIGVGVGLGAGMLGLNPSEGVTDRIRDMRLIQNLSMAKIVDGSRDVNPVTGMGFNAASARSIDSFLRRSASDDPVLKDEDWRKLLQLGIEYGQFDYANNAKQYKEILKKMRGNLTTVMEVIGSTEFKDIMKEFKRLQTMGADINQYGAILRKENMLGRMTGLSHSAMVQTYGQPGALIYSQHGLNNYQGSIQAMNNAATIAMAQRMGILSSATIARHGGVSGMVQTMTGEDADVLANLKDHILPYFMNADLTDLDLSKDPLEILNSKDPLHLISQSWGKLDHPTKAVNYRVHRDETFGKLLDVIPSDLLEAVYANSVGRTMLPGATGPEATRLGFMQLGMSPWHAQLAANEAHSDRFKQKYEREQEIAAQKRREELAVKYNPFRVWTRGIKNWFTDLGEQVFGGLVDRYGQWSEERNLRLQGRGKTFLPGAGVSPYWNDQAKHDRFVLQSGKFNADEDFTPYGKAKVRWVDDKGQIFDWDDARKYGGKQGEYDFSSAVVPELSKDIAEKLASEANRQNGLATPALVQAIAMQESSGRHFVRDKKTGELKPIRSSAGAVGLMQIMPQFVKDFGGGDVNDLDDNIRIGVTEINTYLKNRKGDVRLALMDYNWGPGNVNKWLKQGQPYISNKEAREYPDLVLNHIQGLKRVNTSSSQIPQVQTTPIQLPDVPSNYEITRNLVAKYATQAGVDPRLMEAVILQQSGGKADFVNSETQGVGLFGLTPDVIKKFKVTKPQNAEENIKVGVQHYRALLHHYDNNERLALTAMHIGAPKLDIWLRELDQQYPGHNFTFTNTRTGSLSEQEQSIWQQQSEHVRDFYANVLRKKEGLSQPLTPQNEPAQNPVQPQGTLPLALQKVFIEQAKFQHVDPHLLTALTVQRSNGNVNFVDDKTHATGLFALTPEQAKQLGVDATKPEQNIEGGARQLRQLLEHYHGNERLALTAFSMGKESLDAWLTKVYQDNPDKDFQWKLDLSEEEQKLWQTLPEAHRNVASTVLQENIDRSQIKTAATSAPRTSLGEAKPELLRAISKEIAKRTKDYDHVKYQLGAKKTASGYIDCSGWSESLLATIATSLKDENGQPIFSPQLVTELHQQLKGKKSTDPLASSEIIQSMGKLAGQELDLTGKVRPDNVESVLREGMFIGLDTGTQSWDKDHYKGIDHIAMVYRDPESGKLRISESTRAKGEDGRDGIRSIDASEYFQRAKIRNAKGIYAVDLSALSRPESGLYFATPQDPEIAAERQKREVVWGKMWEMVDGEQKREEKENFNKWRIAFYRPESGEKPEKVWKSLNIKPYTSSATVAQIYFASQNFAEGQTDLERIGRYLQDFGYGRANSQDYNYNELRSALWDPKYGVKNLENSDVLYKGIRQKLEKLGVAPESLDKLKTDSHTQALLAGTIIGMQKREADKAGSDPRSGNNAEELEHFYNTRTEKQTNKIRKLLSDTNQDAVDRVFAPIVETLGLNLEKSNQLYDVLAYDEKSSPEYYPVLNYLLSIQEYSKLQGTKLTPAQQRYKQALYNESTGESHILALGMQRFGKSREEVLRDLKDVRNVKFTMAGMDEETLKFLNEVAEQGSQHFDKNRKSDLKHEFSVLQHFQRTFGYEQGRLPLQLTRGLALNQRLGLMQLLQGRVRSVAEFNTPEGCQKFDQLYAQYVQAGLGSPNQQATLRTLKQKLDAGQTLTDDDVTQLAWTGKTIKLDQNKSRDPVSSALQKQLQVSQALAKQTPEGVRQRLAAEQMARGLPKGSRTNGDLTEETLAKLNKTLEGLNATLRQMNKNYAKNMGTNRT